MTRASISSATKSRFAFSAASGEKKTLGQPNRVSRNPASWPHRKPPIGAPVNVTMLIVARACQGAFGAILVPSALSLLTTTFTEPKERGKAFGVYGAIAAAGGAVGLLLGGALTEYLSWRWTLYVNLIFAGAAFIGGAILLTRQSSQVKPKLDIPGVLLVSSALFCLVYGFSNAATHGWRTPSTWGFLVAGVALLVVFAIWQGRAASPDNQ